MDIWSTMTSCLIVFQESADQLPPHTPPFSLPPSACVRPHPRHSLPIGWMWEGRWGNAAVAPRGVHVGWVDPCAQVGAIKRVAAWERASHRPSSGADRDARHGAHFPGAALRPAAEPLRPQGRLQVYWGELCPFLLLLLLLHLFKTSHNSSLHFSSSWSFFF